MIARNEITGDFIKTKGSNDAFRDGWDRIFGKKEVQEPVPAPAEPPVQVAVEKPDETKLQEDALRQEWWQYCQENQQTFTEPGASGNLVPSFEEWKKLVGKV